MTFVLILLLAARIILEIVYKSSIEPEIFMGRSSKTVAWIDVCVAYFMRYKEHREAGLADAQKE